MFSESLLCVDLTYQIPMEEAVNQTEVAAYRERLNKRQKFHEEASTPAPTEGIRHEFDYGVPVRKKQCNARFSMRR